MSGINRPFIDVRTLIKRAVEIAQPDLQGQAAHTRKGKIVKTYAAEDGAYYADVQPLRLDGSEDEAEPVIPQVEIPVGWGGEGKGLVCPPDEGTECNLGYYGGDRNAPHIINFRGNGQAPACEKGGLRLQQKAGVDMGFKADGTFFINAPAVEITAPRVTIVGDITVKGNINVTGSIYASGTIIDGGGNTNHHSH